MDPAWANSKQNICSYLKARKLSKTTSVLSKELRRSLEWAPSDPSWCNWSIKGDNNSKRLKFFQSISCTDSKKKKTTHCNISHIWRMLGNLLIVLKTDKGKEVLILLSTYKWYTVKEGHFLFTEVFQLKNKK